MHCPLLHMIRVLSGKRESQATSLPPKQPRSAKLTDKNICSSQQAALNACPFCPSAKVSENPDMKDQHNHSRSVQTSVHGSCMLLKDSANLRNYTTQEHS